MFLNRSAPTTWCIFLVATSCAALGQSLVDLRIDGPDEVWENTSAQYRVFAEFEGDLEFEVTIFATLSTVPGTFATITPFGFLQAESVADDAPETIEADFEYGGVSTTASKSILVKKTVTAAGHALQFDGIGDFVAIPPSSSLRYPGTGGWTVEAWVYPYDIHPSSPVTIVGQVSQGVAARDPYSLEMFDGEVAFRVDNMFGASQRVSFPFIANQWSHVAGVYDSATGTLSLFLNGDKVAWSPIATIMESSANYPVLIGGQPGGTAFFDGRIDDVRLWKEARDYCDIRGYADRVLEGTEQNLVAYWNLDAPDSQEVLDASVSGNDGFLGAGVLIEQGDPVWRTSTVEFTTVDFEPTYWSPQQLIPQVSSGDDWDVTISNDGLEMYISSERDGFAEGDIYRATRTSLSSPFATPVRVLELSVLGFIQHDSSIHLSANGLRMYIMRHIGAGPGDFYLGSRTSTTAAWSSPVPIASLNTSGNEWSITVTANELDAVFIADRGGPLRFWTASRATIDAPWSNLTVIDSLVGFNPRDCALTGDGLTLYVAATGPTGLGFWDTWRLKRSSLASPFGTPEHMPTLSSSQEEFGITVSNDGRSFYPVHGPGPGNIYFSELSIPGEPVDGEFDCDGDIDLDDYMGFGACFTGPDIETGLECELSDLDSDLDVDLRDYRTFSLSIYTAP